MILPDFDGDLSFLEMSCISIWNQGKLQISSKVGVDQVKKELVIKGLEREEAHTFLPILISLACIFVGICVVLLKKILTLNFHNIKASEVAYWLVNRFRSEGKIHLSK